MPDEERRKARRDELLVDARKLPVGPYSPSDANEALRERARAYEESLEALKDSGPDWIHTLIEKYALVEDEAFRRALDDSLKQAADDQPDAFIEQARRFLMGPLGLEPKAKVARRVQQWYASRTPRPWGQWESIRKPAAEVAVECCLVGEPPAVREAESLLFSDEQELMFYRAALRRLDELPHGWTEADQERIASLWRRIRERVAEQERKHVASLRRMGSRLSAGNQEVRERFLTLIAYLGVYGSWEGELQESLFRLSGDANLGGEVQAQADGALRSILERQRELERRRRAISTRREDCRPGSAGGGQSAHKFENSLKSKISYCSIDAGDPAAAFACLTPPAEYYQPRVDVATGMNVMGVGRREEAIGDPTGSEIVPPTLAAQVFSPDVGRFRELFLNDPREARSHVLQVDDYARSIRAILEASEPEPQGREGGGAGEAAFHELSAEETVEKLQTLHGMEAIQAFLDAFVVGRSWGDLKDNYRIADSVSEHLKSEKLRIICLHIWSDDQRKAAKKKTGVDIPEQCGQPSLLRCYATPGAPSGIFRLQHSKHSVVTNHCLSKKVPELKLITAAPDGRRST